MKLLLITICASLFLVSGCTQLKSLLYEQEVSMNTVTLQDGSTVQVPSTNYVVNPNISAGIKLAGDVAPAPWASMVANLVLGAMAVGGSLIGRKYKKATVTTIQTLEAYRQATLKLDGGEELDEAQKTAMVQQQKSGGVFPLISSLVDQFTSKTK